MLHNNSLICLIDTLIDLSDIYAKHVQYTQSPNLMHMNTVSTIPQSYSMPGSPWQLQSDQDLISYINADKHFIDANIC